MERIRAKARISCVRDVESVDQSTGIHLETRIDHGLTSYIRFGVFRGTTLILGLRPGQAASTLHVHECELRTAPMQLLSMSGAALGECATCMGCILGFEGSLKIQIGLAHSSCWPSICLAAWNDMLDGCREHRGTEHSQAQREAVEDSAVAKGAGNAERAHQGEQAGTTWVRLSDPILFTACAQA